MRLTDHLIDRLTVARRWTLNLVEDIEPERWFDMPPSGTGHVAWQLGHLAASQLVLIHNRCFDKPFTDSMRDDVRHLFARGSTPVAGSGGYPPMADIRAMFDRIQNEAIALISTLSDAELESPAGDPHPLFSTKAGAIGTAALHETFHAGQIAMLRRHFGKAPLR